MAGNDHHQKIHEWIAHEALMLLDVFKGKGYSPADTLAVLAAAIAAVALEIGKPEINSMNVNELTGRAVRIMEERGDGKKVN
jgi:hypothetical protein